MAILLGPYHAHCKTAGKQWTGSSIVNAGILKWPLDMCYLRGDARLPKHAIGLSYTHTPKLPLNSTVVKILAILWNCGYPISDIPYIRTGKKKSKPTNTACSPPYCSGCMAHLPSADTSAAVAWSVASSRTHPGSTCESLRRRVRRHQSDRA